MPDHGKDTTTQITLTTWHANALKMNCTCTPVVLAVAAGRQTNLTHQPYRTVPPSIAQHLIYKAVECLRKYFASGEDRLNDKHIIAILTCVSSYEWYLGDYEASRIHLQAVEHPFALLDESCEYDRWVIAMASHPDLYMVVESLSLLVLPAKGPGQYPGSIPPASIGQSRKALLDHAYFGAVMAPVITDLLPCMQVWKSDSSCVAVRCHTQSYFA
jgi:hypothetical protein